MSNKLKDLLQKLKNILRKNKIDQVDKTDEFLPPLEEEKEAKLSKLKNLSAEILFTLKTKLQTIFSRAKYSRLKKMPSETAHKEVRASRKINFKLNLKGLEKLKNILSDENRTTIHRSFLILLILISFYSTGKIMALFITSSSNHYAKAPKLINFDYSKELTPALISQMMNSKIIKTDKKEGAPLEKEKGPEIKKCKVATKETRLPLKLVNTIVLQDSVKSIASVQVRTNDLSEFREGDEIEGLAKVDKIERQNIIVKNLKDGTCENVRAKDGSVISKSPIAVLSPKESKVFTSQKKKIEGIENDGNNFTVSKAFMKDKMGDISTILTQARGIQITNPDGTISFKVVEVDPSGIFSYLGIQENDVITQINGAPISDLNQVMNLFGRLTSLDDLSLTVDRNGEKETQDYKFR